MLYYARFYTLSELTDFVNNIKKLNKDEIITIIHDTNIHEYVLIYFR